MFLGLQFVQILIPSTVIWTFLVEFEDLGPSAYAQAFFNLKVGLEALFKRPVDLLTPSSLTNPFFRRRVAAECQTLYAS